MSIFDEMALEREPKKNTKSNNLKPEIQAKSIFDEMAQEKQVQQKEKEFRPVARAAKGAAQGLGSYGDILDLIGAQSKEGLLPGQKALMEAEERVPEHMKPYFTEDSDFQHYGRLPSSEDMSKFSELLGAPKGEGETFIERALERGARGVTSAAALGGTPTSMALGGVGGALGQGVEELTESPILGMVAEVATGLTPSLKSLKKVKKPSGIPEYRFENIKNPKHISQKNLDKIDMKIEKSVRGRAQDLLSENRTIKNVKSNKNFKEELQSSFKKVREMADEIPYKVDNQELGIELVKEANKKIKPGITPSEYETAYKKNIEDILKKTKRKDVSIGDMVDQYRKNNLDLGEIFEPGAAKSINRAKADAIIDYNISIANTLEKELPGNPFTKMFKNTNEEWKNIMNLETVESTMDKMFVNGLNFNEAKKAVDSKKFNYALNNLVGKEGSKAFNTLMEDLLSYKDARKMLKVSSREYGLKGAASDLAKYLIHPALITPKYLKAGIRQFQEFMLTQPKLMIKWSEALKQANSGNLSAAIPRFQAIEKEYKKSNHRERNGRRQPK